MPKRAAVFTQHIVKAKRRAVPYELRDGAGNGLIIRVQPTGKRIWYVKLKSGKRLTIGDVSGITLTMARDKAAKYRWHGGKPPEEIEQEAATEGIPSLGKFLEKRFAPHFEAQHDDSRHLENFRAFDGLRHQPLDQLSPSVLDAWVEGRLDPKERKGKKAIKPVGKATVRRNLGALKGLLVQAVRWGVIPASPLQHYSPIKQADNARTRVLTPEEEARLRKALDEDDTKRRKAIKKERAWVTKRYKDNPTKLHARLNGTKLNDPWLKTFVLLALNTGARQGQLRKLEWRDVDFDRRLLTLRAETSKSKKISYVPLNAEAIEALRLMPIGKGQQPVFPGRGKTSKYIVNPNGPWDKLMTAAKIEDFTFHSLRHSFASALVNNGVDLYRVQRLLTHSDAKLTQRYAHLDPEYLRDAVEKLDGKR